MSVREELIKLLVEANEEVRGLPDIRGWAEKLSLKIEALIEDHVNDRLNNS